MEDRRIAEVRRRGKRRWSSYFRLAASSLLRWSGVRDDKYAREKCYSRKRRRGMRGLMFFFNHKSCLTIPSHLTAVFTQFFCFFSGVRLGLSRFYQCQKSGCLRQTAFCTHYLTVRRKLLRKNRVLALLTSISLFRIPSKRYPPMHKNENASEKGDHW